MGRTAKDNRDLPHPKPVEKIQLSEKHTKLRLVIVVLFIVIGVVSLVYAALTGLRVSSGWTNIQVSSAAEMNCSSEFIFQYHLGADGNSAVAENREISALYTEAVQKAYQIFSAEEAFEGICNVYYINHHPNEVIEVDELLYRAFETCEAYENRLVYLGPVYEQYNSLFFCQNDSEAVHFDPYQNEELADFAQKIADFAVNEDAIELQLLGDNRVMLSISGEYQRYADENLIERFLDFFWMKNAFIIDYFADVMIENGFTKGNFSSYDGFVRNLDASGTSEYAFGIYNRVGNEISLAGTMQYSDALSIVSLRDYPMNNQDFQHYYELEDGSIRTPYVDIRDGLCRTSTANLVSYSKELGCAEILLQMIPGFISEVFDEAAVPSPGEKEIFSVYFVNGSLCSNDSSIKIK